jgi:hypothetical protein
VTVDDLSLEHVDGSIGDITIVSEWYCAGTTKYDDSS